MAGCFCPTEYGKELCGLSATVSRPDQNEVESQVEADSNDEDSTMEDAENGTNTPQTMSVAPFDSRNASEESTRASTPIENCDEDVPADIDSLKPFEQEDVADDVTMKDVGPGQNGPAGAADEFSKPTVVSWPSSTVIDPGSSPWKVEKTKEKPFDSVSDPQKLEGLLRDNETDSPDFYKP